MRENTKLTMHDILDFDNYDDFDLEMILRCLRIYAKYQIKHNKSKEVKHTKEIIHQITKSINDYSKTMGYCPFTIIKPSYVGLILKAFRCSKKYIIARIEKNKRSLFSDNIQKLRKYQRFIQNKANLNILLTYQKEKDASLMADY